MPILSSLCSLGVSHKRLPFLAHLRHMEAAFWNCMPFKIFPQRCRKASPCRGSRRCGSAWGHSVGLSGSVSSAKEPNPMLPKNVGPIRNSNSARLGHQKGYFVIQRRKPNVWNVRVLPLMNVCLVQHSRWKQWNFMRQQVWAFWTCVVIQRKVLHAFQNFHRRAPCQSQHVEDLEAVGHHKSLH